MEEGELYMKNDRIIQPSPPPYELIMFDLKIDENGVEYKGERIEDAGKVYRALCQMLVDQGYCVEYK